MVARHANGGVTEPINVMYLSFVVPATPLIRNGAPVVHKRKHNDVSPYGQTFELDMPRQLGGGKVMALLHAVADPVTGGAWVHPETKTTKARLQEYWARPGENPGEIGHIFHFPIEADAAEQCVSRKLEIGGRSVNLYEEEKGYTLATKEQVLSKMDEADRNYKADMERKRNVDPQEQRRLLAEAIGDGTKTVLAGAFKTFVDNFKTFEKMAKQGA